MSISKINKLNGTSNFIHNRYFRSKIQNIDFRVANIIVKINMYKLHCENKYLESWK